MPKESEVAKRITRAVKAGDKLVKDIQRDIGQLIAAANGVKEIFGDIKNKLKGPDDKEV
jgi:hypothetical protein